MSASPGQHLQILYVQRDFAELEEGVEGAILVRLDQPAATTISCHVNFKRHRGESDQSFHLAEGPTTVESPFVRLNPMVFTLKPGDTTAHIRASYLKSGFSEFEVIPDKAPGAEKGDAMTQLVMGDCGIQTRPLPKLVVTERVVNLQETDPLLRSAIVTVALNRPPPSPGVFAVSPELVIPPSGEGSSADTSRSAAFNCVVSLQGASRQGTPTEGKLGDAWCITQSNWKDPVQVKLAWRRPGTSALRFLAKPVYPTGDIHAVKGTDYNVIYSAAVTLNCHATPGSTEEYTFS